MSRATLPFTGTAAEVSLRRVFEEALFEVEKAYRVLPPEEQRQLAADLRKYRAESQAEPRRSHRCEDVESFEPYAVKCQACQKFKPHHLWPCPKFDLSEFEWLEPLFGGEVVAPSTDSTAYFGAAEVRYLIWQRKSFVRLLKFFGHEVEVGR